MKVGDFVLKFFLNKIFSQPYKNRDRKVLSFANMEKRKMTPPPNETLRLFHSELRTTSAPEHSVCYMLYKDSEKVQLIAYRYDNRKDDLEGNGKVFGTLDKARAFAFNKGYIIPEAERASSK